MLGFPRTEHCGNRLAHLSMGFTRHEVEAGLADDVLDLELREDPIDELEAAVAVEHGNVVRHIVHQGLPALVRPFYFVLS
jgi:hypothetical protein